MRDSRHDVFDKEFIDNQWATMEKLLDKKLPVSKPAQDTRLTLLLLSMLLTSFIGSTIFYAYKYKTTIPTVAVIKEHTVYKTKYIPDSKVTLEQPTSDTHTSVASKIDNLKKQSTKKPQAKKLIEQVKDFFKPALTTLEYHEDIQAEQKSIVAEESLRMLAELAAIARIESSVMSLPEESTIQEEEFPTQPAEATSKKKRTISYNVGVETLVSTDLDFTGLGVQSGLTIPVGNKLGINTGVAVNYITKDEYFVYPLHRNQPAETKAPELRNLRQVYIPVGLNYSLTKNIALNSGLRVRYTYSDEVEGKISARPSRAPISDNESILDNTNFGLTAGFAFRINNNFSLLLNSEWKVQSIIGTNPTPLTDPKFDRNMVNLTTSFTF